ncbi:MAG TPA: lysophospholipid acyltransferase family protein [bacterium]|nr:lysophospholipid acyltransferase family protein [bacterium]HOL49156.1 lysophospholipid acyltransferase family protein [bacterium]HPO51477.1 lysophospholipid acyltransferase family protein [bacterium]HXK44330.1 lysophospholipid acyltransferase family protein [bacterium]
MIYFIAISVKEQNLPVSGNQFIKYNKSMRRKKREHIADIFGYLFFFGVFNIIRLLPSMLYPRIGKTTGKFFYIIAGSLKKKIRNNIIAAYGNQLSPEERTFMTKKIIEKNTFFFIEWALWTKIHPQCALTLIEFKNIEPLMQVCQSKKPVILVSAHLGNFALMIAALIYAGLPVTWIARDANNQYLARYMDRIRRKKGVFGINKANLSQAIGLSLDWLKQKKALCLLIDQHSGKGTEVCFFGKIVQAPTGAAVFARRFDASVFGVFIKRRKKFKHTIFIEGPYNLAKTTNPEQDYQNNTQFFYNRIEYYVKQSPEEWFTWLHRRFR